MTAAFTLRAAAHASAQESAVTAKLSLRHCWVCVRQWHAFAIFKVQAVQERALTRRRQPAAQERMFRMHNALCMRRPKRSLALQSATRHITMRLGSGRVEPEGSAAG